MKASGGQTLVRLILTSIWCLPLLIGGFLPVDPARAEAVEAGPVQSLDDDFSFLKEQFEFQARKNPPQSQLSLLSLETAAQAWILAAINLTEDPEARDEWRQQAARLSSFRRETGPKDGAAAHQDLEARHTAALELYYQAFRELALYLVTVRPEKHLAQEMKSIHRLTRDKLARLTDQPQRELEKRVILSGALVALATVAVRSLGGQILSAQMEGLVKGWLTRTEILSRRSDLHYRAKLQLLYIGNLRRLTALIFLLGRQAGPPLSRELAALHGSLNIYGPQRGLPGAQGLLWAAQAQAAIPLAYWLSHQARNVGDD